MQLNLRSRNEAAHVVLADRSHETALDDLRNRSLYRAVRFLELLQLFPALHAIGFNLGEGTAVLAAEGLNVDLDDVIDFHDILSGLRSRISELAVRNQDILLVADIDHSTVVIHAHDRTIHNRADLDVVQLLGFLLHSFRHGNLLVHFFC